MPALYFNFYLETFPYCSFHTDFPVLQASTASSHPGGLSPDLQSSLTYSTHCESPTCFLKSSIKWSEGCHSKQPLNRSLKKKKRGRSGTKGHHYATLTIFRPLYLYDHVSVCLCDRGGETTNVTAHLLRLEDNSVAFPAFLTGCRLAPHCTHCYPLSNLSGTYYHSS